MRKPPRIPKAPVPIRDDRAANAGELPLAAPRPPTPVTMPVRPPVRPPARPPAPAPAPTPAAGVGAKLAKPGYGLTMRTTDGEDSVTPFKSLEDLLSAVKPILRNAASSAEPVWFSVQPIDLSEIDMDAA